MRPTGCALILGLAVGGAPLAGCGSDDSGNASDGAAGEASTEAAAEGAADGALDVIVVRVPPSDDAADAGVAESAVADGTSQGAADSGALEGAVETVFIAVDATVLTTAAGGCAAASSLIAAPNETSVGHAISLNASGIDSSGQSSDVVLTWTASGGVGTLAGDAGTSTSFTCSSGGTETITVTASIADGGASCPTIGSLQITVLCDAP